MKPGRYDILMTEGDDYSCTITFRDSAGAAKNYSANSFEAWFGKVGIKVEVAAINVTSAATGIIVVSLTEAQTIAIPDRGAWELKMVASGVTTTMLAGEYTKTPRVR